MSIEIFGFRALWSPYYFIALVVLSLGFFLITSKYRNRFTDSEKLTQKQIGFFLTAMILLYLVKGSPLDLLGHIMFSAHMTQMAVLYLIITPLFILSIPNWLWRAMFSVQWIEKMFTIFTKPLYALLIFNIVFSLYHIPLVFDMVKTSMWLHGGYTSLLFVLSLFMWFPLVNQLPEKETLTGLYKVGYIFGSGILMTPACALIIFANYPMYDTFTNPSSWATAMELCVPASALASLNLSGPEMFSNLPALEDQQLGGVLMKVIQEIVLGVVLGYIFFAWFRKENGEDKIDPIPAHLQTNE